MNHKQLLEDYYCVCDIADDNLEIVVSLIHFYQIEDDRIGRIRADITDWSELDRLERYAKTFKNILSFDIRNVKHVIAILSGRVNSQVVKIQRNKVEVNNIAKDYIYVPPRSEKAPASTYCANPLFEGIE